MVFEQSPPFRLGFFRKKYAMETVFIETVDGVIEAVSLETAAQYGLDDHDAMGDKSPESEIDVWVEDEHV